MYLICYIILYDAAYRLYVWNSLIGYKLFIIPTAYNWSTDAARGSVFETNAAETDPNRKNETTPQKVWLKYYKSTIIGNLAENWKVKILTQRNQILPKNSKFCRIILF